MDIQKTIAQMTLEEKASLCSGLDFWHTKPVDRLGVPSVMVSDGPHGLRKQSNEADHLGVNESIKAVCFPPACATAASFDRDMVRAVGEAIGDACQHEALSVVLGPAVNIKRSPLCGRNFEYFSEDPYLAGEMGVSLTQGVQSRNVGVSVKHFAANSQENRRMSSNSVVDERTLREIYFPAFEATVKRGKAWTVMCSYNILNGTYACENHWLLTDVLRGEWGFDGYVVSDWGATADRVKCLKAGMDLEMPASAGINDQRIVDAVRAGELDEKVVDQAVARILTINERYLRSRRPDTVWDKEAQHELARRAAAECMVLLKNEGGILPLKSGARVAILGEFAKTPRYQGGGSSHINSFKVTSLTDALADEPNITYAQGYRAASDELDEALLNEAVEAARAAEVAVIVAGLPDRYESEGYDREHMRMPDAQNELIARVAEVNPNTVVVLYNGSPVEMPWIGQVKGLIEGYLGGQAVGGATKDVLYGTVNPCGRLAETLPLRLEDTPAYLSYGGEKNTAVYNEGVFVGYRYYDKRKMNVLFPFGYGLSYTNFELRGLRLSASEIHDTDQLTVTVEVVNTGSRAGKDVVQLYVGDKESTVFRPVRELKGFEKIWLEPGEAKTLTFTLDKRAFAYWNAALNDWHVETGAFTIEVGHSSRDIALSQEVTVVSTVEVPEKFTLNSIFMDLMANPRAKVILAPMLDAMLQGMGLKSDAASDVATSAISPQMMSRMFDYMPLRAMLSFGGGRITREQLEGMLKMINGD